MATEINKKITGYKVLTEETKPEKEEIIPLIHKAIERPEHLLGTTYKVKSPNSEHALYITINDFVLNNERIPYEIFINSKNMEHFQWVLALTRVISACFCKGGEINFLVDELKSVFDPRGGYFKKGGVYMPSLVAEIGQALEAHLKGVGAIGSYVKGVAPIKKRENRQE